MSTAHPIAPTAASPARALFSSYPVAAGGDTAQADRHADHIRQHLDQLAVTQPVAPVQQRDQRGQARAKGAGHSVYHTENGPGVKFWRPPEQLPEHAKHMRICMVGAQVSTVIYQNAMKGKTVEYTKFAVYGMIILPD
jgi:hypothetical protein